MPEATRCFWAKPLRGNLSHPALLRLRRECGQVQPGRASLASSAVIYRRAVPGGVACVQVTR
ncbi:MAG TPA: hypothetical protein PLY56_06025, partial [Armatimonadota bacterium]|nr:hypothetical protein [Armatimonadota bacterium]